MPNEEQVTPCEVDTATSVLMGAFKSALSGQKLLIKRYINTGLCIWECDVLPLNVVPLYSIPPKPSKSLTTVQVLT